MTSKFMKYGLGIGVAAVGGMIWMEKRIQSNLRSQDYYKESVILLQKYEPAGEIFGRPILSGRLTLESGSDMHIGPLSAKIYIPIKGPKNKGTLFVMASREDVEDRWTIDQLDLEVSSSKQRWKFYDRSLASSLPDTDRESLEINS